MRLLSPLRYPGGKASLADVIRMLLYANGAQGGTYMEPFAGGAGAGLKLLGEGHVDQIIINDFDRSVYCFWKCVMQRTDQLIELILNVPLTVAEWRKQRAIYTTPKGRSELEIGFSTFYLNRCNRSGIIANAGPIGGLSQNGDWGIDARFNRAQLALRVSEVASYGDRILVTRMDAMKSLKDVPGGGGSDRLFVYADPPYYVKGKGLYLNHFRDEDHAALAKAIRARNDFVWVMTYDDVPRIRELYSDLDIKPFRLRYSAHHSSSTGGELLISPKHVVIPACASKALFMLKAKE